MINMGDDAEIAYVRGVHPLNLSRNLVLNLNHEPERGRIMAKHGKKRKLASEEQASRVSNLFSPQMDTAERRFNSDGARLPMSRRTRPCPLGSSRRLLRRHSGTTPWTHARFWANIPD